LGRVAEGIASYSIENYFRPGGDEAGPNTQQGPGALRRVSGVLANSIQKEMDGQWGVKIGASAEYARVHEEGAQIGNRTIPARPYLRPAIEDWFQTPVAQRVFDREFRKLQRRFNR
jgi:phage gpG-like protein